MDTAYQIDVIELKAGALAKAGPALHLPPDLMRLLELTNLLIERAIAAERLETAEQMADLLMETAKKLRESEIRKQATARLKQVRAAAAEDRRLRGVSRAAADARRPGGQSDRGPIPLSGERKLAGGIGLPGPGGRS